MTLIIPKLALLSYEEQGKRLEELQRLRLLDASSEERFDRYTALAATALKTPMAAIVVVDKETLCFKSSRGLPRENPPQHLSFAAHALSIADVLVVPDASLDPRFAEHPIVRAGPRVRLYAGAAVRGRGGVPLGVVCVADCVPREFSQEEREILLEVACLLEHEIQTYATVQELNDRLSRQSLYDPGTGLPNETLFLSTLAELLDLRRGKTVALALVKLNRFEQVHRALGKVGADHAIDQAATRLRQACDTGTLLGRP